MNMKRRTFLGYSAALAATACTSPLSITAQTGSSAKSPGLDALYPSGIRVAACRLGSVARGEGGVWTQKKGRVPGTKNQVPKGARAVRAAQQENTTSLT